MKTKLLKKIRKRYEVFRVDNIDKYNQMYAFRGITKEQLPVYYVIDNDDGFIVVYDTRDMCLEQIKHYIKRYYSHLRKNDKDSFTKVWHKS